MIEKLARQKNPRQLWNVIKKSRRSSNTTSNAISLEKLESLFEDKLNNNNRSSEVIDQAEKEAKSHPAKCYQETYPDFLFTEGQIKSILSVLKEDLLVESIESVQNTYNLG